MEAIRLKLSRHVSISFEEVNIECRFTKALEPIHPGPKFSFKQAFCTA